ncbi:peroxiredoxin family protein, partial [Bacteroidota bacterium]
FSILHVTANSQNLPRLNKAFPDFTLKNHKGQTISLSDLKGKNVILVFPRGKVSDHWCQLCHYQYAELAKLEKEKNIREKYNLEVVFILPLTMDETILWANMFPSQMADIARWKSMPTNGPGGNPSPFLAAIKEILPMDFSFDENNPAPLPFSILADEDHKFSMGIKLFTTMWDGFYNEQNEATTFILDKDGIVRFKYKSQETFDRPSAEYLLNFIEKIMN